MGSWVWCKAPFEHLLLSSNPAVDTSHASLLSHPHSPPSWLMISLSFDVLMKSLRLHWMAGPLLANYSIKCKWRGNVTGVICLVNMSYQGYTLFFFFFRMWIHNGRLLDLNDAGLLRGDAFRHRRCSILSLIVFLSHSYHFSNKSE